MRRTTFAMFSDAGARPAAPAASAASASAAQRPAQATGRPLSRLSRLAGLTSLVGLTLAAQLALAPSARAEGLVLPGQDLSGGHAAAFGSAWRAAQSAQPVRLLGHWYLFPDTEHPGAPPEGLRASTGLATSTHRFSLFDAAAEPSASQAWLGLGWSQLWLRSQLSLSADLGLTAPNAMGGPRRPVLGGSLPLDDSLRELRWAPAMALNLSYAF